VVPYPHAADDHQRANADVFTAAGGCLTLDQRELTGRFDDHLADVLRSLLEESDVRRSMAQAMGRMARPGATQQVVAILEGLLPGQGHAATGRHERRAA
jgi:UDP-N-acetylglucosamine--N-acetylmuramyl-(pentapeptide) pyrophosphoryl-undecaprenol N-acetylglucosamine transferase